MTWATVRMFCAMSRPRLRMTGWSSSAGRGGLGSRLPSRTARWRYALARTLTRGRWSTSRPTGCARRISPGRSLWAARLPVGGPARYPAAGMAA